MDCTPSTTSAITTNDDINSLNSTINDDHLLPSNESATARVISVCEIQPSFYLTTPIRRLFDPSTDQSTPNEAVVSIDCHNNNTNINHNIDSITPPLTNIQNIQYSNDDSNKENSHYLSTLTTMTLSSSSSSDIQNTAEVKKSSIYRLILKNPLYR